MVVIQYKEVFQSHLEIGVIGGGIADIAINGGHAFLGVIVIPDARIESRQIESGLSLKSSGQRRRPFGRIFGFHLIGESGDIAAGIE